MQVERKPHEHHNDTPSEFREEFFRKLHPTSPVVLPVPLAMLLASDISELSLAGKRPIETYEINILLTVLYSRDTYIPWALQVRVEMIFDFSRGRE